MIGSPQKFIKAGYFVEFKRVARPDEDTGEIKFLPCYAEGESLGKGFALGVSAFLKLFKNLFCLPIDGRMTRGDLDLYHRDIAEPSQVNDNQKIILEINIYMWNNFNHR